MLIHFPRHRDLRILAFCALHFVSIRKSGLATRTHQRFPLMHVLTASGIMYYLARAAMMASATLRGASE